MSWLVFALIWPALTGILIVIEKILRTRYIKDSFVLSVVWGLSVLILLPAFFFFEMTLPSFTTILFASMAGALALLAFIPFYYALSFEEVSRVAPLWQLSSVFVLFGAAILLEENLKWTQYLAFAFILVGGLLIALKKTKYFFTLSPAVSFIMLGGLIIAASHLFLEFGVIEENVLSVTLWIYIGHALAAAVFFARASFRKRFFAAMSSLPAAGYVSLFVMLLVGVSSTVILVLALQSGPVSIVSVIGNMRGLFVLLYTVLLSMWFPYLLKENIKRSVFYHKLIAMILLLIGVLLLLACNHHGLPLGIH